MSSCSVSVASFQNGGKNICAHLCAEVASLQGVVSRESEKVMALAKLK